MALTKINGFTGEAELLGSLHEVQFTGGNLTIYGLSLDAAYDVLDALAAKAIVATRVRGEKTANFVEKSPFRSEQLANSPQGEGADSGSFYYYDNSKNIPESEPGSQKATPPARPPRESAMRAVSAKSEASRGPSNATADVEAPPAKAKQSASKAAAASASKEQQPETEQPPFEMDAKLLEFPPKDEGDAVPDNILKSGRFVEVLDWVMKAKGLKPTQEAELLAELSKLKETPAVRRVRDLKDKLASTLAAYEEVGNAAAS